MPHSFDTLVPLGWDGRVHSLYNEIASPGTQPGRVVRVERSACVVAIPGGELRPRAHPLPAVGDWAAVKESDDRGIVRDVVPRWSALVREDPSGGAQVLAANVDFVLITTPPERRPGRTRDPGRLGERREAGRRGHEDRPRRAGLR
ncbi:MAG: hypothetical protein ACRDT7_14275, partial [Microbacterium sp.]